MSVISLNPDHPLILEMNARVDQIIAERTARNERTAEYLALVRQQKGLFDKASNLEKSGKSLDAIKAYDVVVGSRLPDPANLKSKAKRSIASIQQKLTVQQAEFEKEADQAFKKGDLKTGINTLKKALEINPENETLKGRIHSSLSELKRQMQVLYQEGVLEESVGEIETAKAKWKKILESSIPEEDYYKKSKAKLRKYEAG
jgi:tetratricopeptide (TPR) repeat protein